MILAAATTVAAALCLAVVAPSAQASVSCPSENVGQPTVNVNGDLRVNWSAQCNGAMWLSEIQLQYESGGSWFLADCESGSACDHAFPSDGTFFSAGSFHSDQANFNPVLQICAHRWRALMFIKTPNPPNPHFTFTSSILAKTC